MLGPDFGREPSHGEIIQSVKAHISLAELAMGRVCSLRVLRFSTQSIRVEISIYLGTVNLAMGYPLFIATAYGSWMILKNEFLLLNLKNWAIKQSLIWSSAAADATKSKFITCDKEITWCRSNNSTIANNCCKRSILRKSYLFNSLSNTN